MRTIKYILTSLLLVGMASAQQSNTRAQQLSDDGSLAAPDRLIVQHRLGADAGAIQEAFGSRGAQVARYHDSIRMSVIQVAPARRAQIQKELDATGLFNFVELDHLAKVEATPNDPNLSSEWQLAAIQAQTAWNYTTGSSSVIVAMIDSGIDGTHPDLAANLVPGYNFLAGNTNTSDTMGHGTTTAGVVGAVGNNGIGMAGVNWKVSLMPLVVVDSTGYASYSNIASAITYAADHGARIVNISIGGTSSSSVLQSAVNYAWSKGTVVFASAGNGGVNAPYYPAGCQYVVAVGATDSNNTWAGFSNYGNFLSVVAPGVGVWTTYAGGGYGGASGTSYSSPIAAAVGALMLSYQPNLSASALVSTLEQTATDLGTSGYDQYYGYGLINAAAAISGLVSSPVITPPTVTMTNPTNSETVSGTVPVTGTATASAGLASVKLFVDGNLTGTENSAPYSLNWNTTSTSNAAHTVTVQAVDMLNNVAQTSATVTVNNYVPPPVTPQTPLSIYISTPANNSRVNGNLTVTAVAADSVAITQVCFYVDNVLYATDSTTPYSFSVNAKKLSVGKHILTVKAWDSSGATATSAPVTITTAR